MSNVSATEQVVSRSDNLASESNVPNFQVNDIVSQLNAVSQALQQSCSPTLPSAFSPLVAISQVSRNVPEEPLAQYSASQNSSASQNNNAAQSALQQRLEQKQLMTTTIRCETTHSQPQVVDLRPTPTDHWLGSEDKRPYNPALANQLASGAPYIVVPSSLEVQLNTSNVASTDILDTIFPPAVDTRDMDKAEADVAALENKVAHLTQSIRVNNEALRSEIDKYLRLQYAASRPAEFLPINIPAINNTPDNFDATLVMLLRQSCSLLTNSGEYIEQQIRECKQCVNTLRDEIAKAAQAIVDLTNERIGKQAKLLMAQNKYVREMSRHPPPKVLSGDEILAAYMRNEINADGDNDY